MVSEKVRVDIEQHFKKLNILKAFVGNAPAYKIAAERDITNRYIATHWLTVPFPFVITARTGLFDM